MESSVAMLGYPGVSINEAVFIKHLPSDGHISGPSPAPRIHCPFHKYLQIIHHGPGTVLSMGDGDD